MNIEIGNLARERLLNTTILAEIPGLNAGLNPGINNEQSNITINTAIDCIVGEFTDLAHDSMGRQRLYEAASNQSATPTIADRLLLPHERDSALKQAQVQLQTVVGHEGSHRLVENFRKESNLTKSQAIDTLASVSPSVIDALRSELASGTVENSTTGIATLLNVKNITDKNLHVVETRPETAHVEETHIETTHAETTSEYATEHQVRNSEPAYQAARSSQGVAVESDNSWLMRFALPFMLLGALLLGTLKYCSEAEKSQLVAEERSNLQGELTVAQTDLQATKAELEAVRDIPTDTAELQQSLASVTGERDAAINSGSELQKQLEQVNTERDQALQQGESLSAELDQARETITANEESIANIGKLQAEVEEITASRDDTLERNVELSAANTELQEQVDSIAPTISDLESKVESLTSSSSELDQQLTGTSQALEEEKVARKTDVDQLTSEVERLQGEVDTSAPTIEKLEGQVAALFGEKKHLETKLETTTSALTDERAARQSDTQQLTAEATGLQDQLTQMLGFRNTAETSLKQQEEKVAQQTETITGLEEKVASLEEANVEAGISATVLQKQIDELNVELESAQDSIGSRDATLAERDESLAATNQKLEVAQGEVNRLAEQRDELMAVQNDQQQTIEALTTEKAGALDEIASRDEKISSLTDELQTANTEKTAANTRIDELNQQAAELDTVLENERLTIAELESSLQSLKQGNSSLQEKFGAANVEIDDLTAQLASSGSLVDQKQQTIETLNSTVAKLEAAGSELTQERDNALLKTAAMQKSLSASDQEISTLTGNRDALQNQIEAAAAKAQKSVDETLALRKAIEKKLSEAGVEGAKVQAIEDDQAVAITLVSGSLYQTGNASLTSDGREVLSKVGNIVADYSDWNVDVEGHTDSLGIGAVLREQYPTNWELSSARASAAVRHLKSKSVIDPETTLSASGFADTRPIADNDNAQGREQNRRVDIILRR